MAGTTSSRAPSKGSSSKSSVEPTSKSGSSKISPKPGKTSLTSSRHETKARESLRKDLARDFSTKTESERKRIENQIVKKVLRTEQDSWHLARRHGQTKENWLRSEARKCEKEYARRKNEEKHYYSNIEERIKPIQNEITLKGKKIGTWTGNKGDSKFIPDDTSENESINTFLKDNDIDGIEYKDGVPDFFMVADASVEISDMTQYRHRNERPDRKEGNFEQAYAALAEKFNVNEKDEKTNWTSDEVKDWAKDPSMHDGHILIVHENPDTKTCDFVRDDIHSFFKHAGGCLECKIRDNQNGRWSDYKIENDDGGFDE